MKQYLANMNVAITGKVNGFNRSDVDILLKDLGANVVDQVNTTTHLVFVANYGIKPANTTKLKKANELGIPQMSASHISEMVNGTFDSQLLDLALGRITNKPTAKPSKPVKDVIEFIQASSTDDQPYCI